MSTSGIGGSFNDPSQLGWMNTKSESDPLVGGGRQTNAQQNSTQVGSSQNVLLASPEEMSAKIPLFIKAGPIGFQPSAANHPLLDLSFDKFRDVSEGGSKGNLESFIAYESLFNALSKNLQDKLNAEMQKPIEERDPDVHALSLSLDFTASTLSILSSFSREIDEKSPIFKTAADYQSLPDSASYESLAFTASVLTAFENHANNALGPNHPQFDGLMGILNEVKGILKELASGK
jgi:hypothetical protein